MNTWPKRVNQMSAVELASGQQIERGGKHSHPDGDRHWMKINIRRRKRNVDAAMLGEWRQQFKELRIAKLRTRCVGQVRVPAGMQHSPNQRWNRNHETGDR